MNEEIIITQLGLLLTTMRYSRRALEDIERSTSKYMGISFAPLLSEGPRFGQPPMLNGALKVYIVNINDLTEPPAGGLLEGLLGGAGRFLGGLLGGFVGGTVSGVLFPWVIASLSTITQHVDQILARIERIVSHFQAQPSQPVTPAPAGSAGGMFSGLPGLTAILNDVTNLLRSANGERLSEGQAAPSAGVDQILRLLREISGIVDGLILLLPIVNGFLASLIVRLDQLQLLASQLLEWLVRNVLLLRGLVLVVIQDTIAEAARLAGQLLHIAATMVRDVLTSAFAIVDNLVGVARSALEWVGSGLQGIMTDLMEWLRTGLGEFLIFLGNTPIIQFLFHVVDILPGILPALIKLVHGNDVVLSPAETAMLNRMSRRPLFRGIPSVAGTTPTGTPTPFPDLSAHLPSRSDITSTLNTSRDFLIEQSQQMFTSVERGLTGAATALQTADFDRSLQTHLDEVQARARAFSDALRDPREATASGQTPGRQLTGLEEIATAYEEWLQHGGLETLLSQITRHFERDSTIPDMTRQATQPEPVRSTVQIDRVEVIIEPPPPPSTRAPLEQTGSAGPRSSSGGPLLRDPYAPPLPEDYRRGFIPDEYAYA